MLVYDAMRGERSLGLLPRKSRLRCGCGCKSRATHYGAASGCTMTVGCELYIRRWVKSPQNAHHSRFRTNHGHS